ncbi:MAG: TonB-dependent receptor plug domain-containing protein [Rubrivivax sp.]
MKLQPRLIALAAAAACCQAQAQSNTSAPAAEPQRIEVTGSLIKRTDRETPAPVDVITREDILKSGYATVEDYIKSRGFVDASSIQDGYGTGFVSGLSTISLRGFGSQGTLVLINGRRVAPVAAVDINFGRGSLISVNTIPQGAIDRVEMLKDGASALYGSDAMAGVINYILRREYNGLEASATHSANEWGAGPTSRGSLTFGFGNLDKQRFNVYGGLEVQRRGSVMASDLKNLGDLAGYNKFLTDFGSLERFSANSVASFYGNYYQVPTSLTTTTANTSGPLFLGALAGCPDSRTVGKGVPNRLPGFATSTVSFPNGMCRTFLDDYLEYIAAQDRMNGSVRATFQLSPNSSVYADLMVSQTKTTENLTPYALTTSLVTSTAPTATTWPKVDGSFLRQNAIILPVGHPDNPTNGTAGARPVQLLYRFEDIPLQSISNLNTLRLVAGIQGSWREWDYDSAVMFSQQKNESIRTNRIRSSLLNQAIAGTSLYRFGKANDAAAIRSISTDAVNSGDSSIVALDVRASRELFSMRGGRAAVAVGAEVRREKLESIPDANYQSGDYIGLVANGTSGSRDSAAAYAELRLPVLKTLEIQTAARTESYSDFGNATTGKLGFKWDAVPSILSIRGTGATGFRAPSISQISNSFLLSFHSSQSFRIYDSVRCDSSNPANPVSRSVPPNIRDCNVLGFSSVPAGQNPGNLPTVISANPNLKPETSKSATLGLILNPTKDIDLAIDGWYFERNNEIRVQRGQDIMEAYNANPAANAQYVLRDPNSATWLPGVANSGPIVALIRQYGNFNYSITSGIDYDLNVRAPKTSWGQLALNVTGTYTSRFSQQVLAGTTASEYAGTAIVVEVPKSKGSARLTWTAPTWTGWVRYNHIDEMAVSGTASCQVATSGSNLVLQQNNLCGLGKEASVDLGGSYTGIKNMTVAASVLNVHNSYRRSTSIPSLFTFWDSGLSAQLGRRYSVTVNYKFY